MIARRFVNAWLATLSALAGLAAAGVATPHIVKANPSAEWAIAKHGGRGLFVRTMGRTGRAAVSVNLPDRARQGGQTWYLLKLDARLRLRADSGLGTVYVSAHSNGGTTVQVIVDVFRRAPCGQWVVTDTLDLLRGHIATRDCGRTFELTSTNFVPYGSIRGGRNVLAFQVETIGKAKVDSVLVLPDSGLRVSSRGPAKLRFERVESEDEYETGTWFGIPFELRNYGDRSARRISVQLQPTRGLRVAGATSLRFPSLDPGRSIGGRFRVQARRAGEYRTAVTASSTANQPLIELGVLVAPKGARNAKANALVVFGGIALAGAGILVLSIQYRRRRRPR